MQYSYILERYRLFTESTNIVSNCDAKMEQLLTLEYQLNVTDESVQQRVIEEGRCLAVKRKLDSLQVDMEMLYHSIKK